jgi:DNA-binding MarR family transcriptional regulator
VTICDPLEDDEVGIAAELGLKRPIESPRDEAVVSIVYTSNFIRKVYSALLRRYGLTDVQFNVLQLLEFDADSDGLLTQAQLRSMLVVNSTNLSSLLARMEKRDLIERIPLSHNRGPYALRRTPKGIEIHERAKRDFYAALKEDTRVFTESESDALMRLLERLRACLRNRDFRHQSTDHRPQDIRRIEEELGLKRRVGMVGEGVGLNIVYTGAALRRVSRGLLRPHGLTDVQFNALQVLKYDADERGLTQRELSRMLAVKPASTSTLVGRMEKAGLIERTPVADDKRAYSLRMTSTGKHVHQRAEQDYCRMLSEEMDALDNTELLELLRLLDMVREQFRARKRWLERQRVRKKLDAMISQARLEHGELSLASTENM